MKVTGTFLSCEEVSVRSFRSELHWEKRAIASIQVRLFEVSGTGYRAARYSADT